MDGTIQHAKSLLPEDTFSINPQMLAASHLRSKLAGIGLKKLTGDELETFLRKHRGLIASVRPVLVEVLATIAGPRDAILLTEESGWIIDWICQPGVLATLERDCGIQVGVSLEESSMGTNAVSLALACREPTGICGAQHFCRVFDDWTGVAAPIFAPRDKLVGCVSIMTRGKADLPQKLTLAKLIAKNVQYFQDRPRQANGATGRSSGQALTARQHEVICLFAKGLTYKKIALTLNVSAKAVEAHLDAVRAKWRLRSRRECIRKAVEDGLV